MIQISEELFTANTQPTNTRGSGSLCISANNNSYNPLCPVFHGRKWNQVLVSTKQRGNMGTDVGVYTRGLASEALNNTQYRLGVIQCACLQVFQILEVFKWQHILVELKDEHSEPKSRKKLNALQSEIFGWHVSSSSGVFLICPVRHVQYASLNIHVPFLSTNSISGYSLWRN